METIKCLVRLKNESFDLEWLEATIEERLQDLHKNPSFALRIHTLFIVNELQSQVTDPFLNEKMYKQAMKRLADDPVPNIRFNYAKTSPCIYRRLTNSNKMDISDNLKKMAESDPDFDVKFYAAKAMSEIQIK